MHSPLPDSSALEAGIIEDETPSQLSRVQESVRNLLRHSVLGSGRGSVLVSPTRYQATVEDGDRSPFNSPSRHRPHVQPGVLPSPSSDATTNTASTSLSGGEDNVVGVLVPSEVYRHAVQHLAHQSAMFNTRAIAALNHPDLSDPSLATYIQQKTEIRQRKAWKRSRNGMHKQAKVKYRDSQCLFCVISGLLLSALVGTYLALATTQRDVSPAFHILFILGIIFVTIVFAHSMVRLCVVGKWRKPPRVLILPAQHHHTSHHGRRRSPRTRRRHRELPALTEEAEFIPSPPIAVHLPADEVRPDSREMEATAAALQVQSSRAPRAEWEKEVDEIPNPPPAYGRWRGSVRANPDLLHWLPVPSPVDPEAPALPSPTYEEAMAEGRTGPATYVTRDRPERRRNVQQPRGDLAQAQAVEPEMVEGRGVGLAY